MIEAHRLGRLILNEHTLQLPLNERILRSQAPRQRRTNCNYNADYTAFQAQVVEQYMEEFAFQTTCDPDTPVTREEAMSGPNATHWIAAMDDELKSHQENKTWGPETTLPPGRTCVGTKWLFKIKRDKDGNVLRYKARYVAKGFSQKPGQDFNKTFSPVMQTSLLRSLFALGAEEDWEIDHVDVKTAFLYGEVDEEIYIRAPDGTTRRLHKAIYGLRQAGRQWYNRFHKSFERFGMKRCESDPCCYVLADSPTPLIVVIHVDDCVIFGSDKALVAKFKESLKEEYQISDLGPIKFALGWRIKRDRKRRLLTVNQQRYIIEITKRFGMTESPNATIPANPALNFSKEQSPTNDTERAEMAKIPYLEALGSLLYVATSTRPDIAYAVSELAKFASDPGLAHWEGMKQIIRYLKGTNGMGICYEGNAKSDLLGYVDASYARCPDSRRSRYGGIYLMNNGPVDWRSKMQQIVALSSMESEYIGACEFTRSGVWLGRCLNEIGFGSSLPTQLGIDNKSAITFAEERIVQNRSKHIDTKYHYIRECIADKKIELFYQPTKEMPADIMTKPLPPKAFIHCGELLGIFQVAHDRVCLGLLKYGCPITIIVIRWLLRVMRNTPGARNFSL